jgi:hypothetical protein
MKEQNHTKAMIHDQDLPICL